MSVSLLLAHIATKTHIHTYYTAIYTYKDIDTYKILTGNDMLIHRHMYKETQILHR